MCCYRENQQSIAEHNNSMIDKLQYIEIYLYYIHIMVCGLQRVFLYQIIEMSNFTVDTI